MSGPCAKLQVKCTIVTQEGEYFVGENLCETPQLICPRLPGEGYEKCKSICNQQGHAEEMALEAANYRVAGSTAFLEGHTYFCRNCQELLNKYGVKYMTIDSPPINYDQLCNYVTETYPIIIHRLAE